MDIESRLNSFDPQVRKEALLEAKKMIDEGKTTFEKNDPEIRSILGL